MFIFSPTLNLRSFPLINPVFSSYPHSNILLSSSSSSKCDYRYRKMALSAISKASSEHKPDSNSNSKPKTEKNDDENQGTVFPTTIPKKPRRGRKSEASAVEDFIRNSLEQTFTTIRQENSEILNDTESIMKEKVVDEVESDEVESDETDDEDENEEKEEESGKKKGKKMVVEEECTEWPLDADVGWGIRASEYFEQHAIKNVVGKDGVEIDWEGEIDDNYVKEINCLEWEEFAFHPSPLIVLVFERYNRPSDNWKVLKELEEAAKVYWRAKDRLPPRTVKIDINIERDLAYALKIKECPQILFLKGNRILYREKQHRTSEELVQMIAHFYYKARKPEWMKKEAASSS